MQVVPEDNLFLNPTFADAENTMPPPSWTIYGRLEGANTITVVNADDPYERALHIVDGVSDTAGAHSQIGLVQNVPGIANQNYRLSAKIKGVEGASLNGANLQLRFIFADGKSTSFNQAISLVDPDEWEDIIVEALSPAETVTVRVNLWTSYGPTPQFLIRQLTLVPLDI